MRLCDAFGRDHVAEAKQRPQGSDVDTAIALLEEAIALEPARGDATLLSA